MGTQILTTKDIPASEADTLGPSLWKVVTVLLEFPWETCSRALKGMTVDVVYDAPVLNKADVGIASLWRAQQMQRKVLLPPFSRDSQFSSVHHNWSSYRCASARERSTESLRLYARVSRLCGADYHAWRAQWGIFIISCGMDDAGCGDFREESGQCGSRWSFQPQVRLKERGLSTQTLCVPNKQQFVDCKTRDSMCNDGLSGQCLRDCREERHLHKGELHVQSDWWHVPIDKLYSGSPS